MAIDREHGKSGFDCFHLFVTVDQLFEAASRSPNTETLKPLVI